MIAFDTSFLIDYLDGDESTETLLAEQADLPFAAPSLALFEVYRGATRIGGPEQLETVVRGLDWIDPLALSEPAAREAALIEAELRDAGNPVNLGDVLIAGICRHNGATVVSRDDHFDPVEGLPVETY